MAPDRTIWPGAVEVGRPDQPRRGRFAADRFDLGCVEAEATDHAAGDRRGRSLHEPATLLYQPQGVLKGQAAGGMQCGVFAQTQASHRHGSFGQVAAFVDRSPDGHAGGEDGRLLDIRLLETVGRALKAQGAEIVAQDFVGLGEHRRRGRAGVRHVLAHARRLGALAGE